ncbi:MAG TPA: glycoside hydrolase family 16 protein [Candidatus Dormibacteraeota bacterium]|nr:glycoside hydrolase family 16 protein [Candidatus Dormibacteraeota bacterium]
MKTRLIAAGLAVAVLLVVVLLNETGPGPCTSSAASSCLASYVPSPTTVTSVVPSPRSSLPAATFDPPPSLPIAPSPIPTPPVYTFRDEFNGKTLGAVWGRHWDGFGTTTFSRSQISLGNGLLTIRARRSGSRYIGGLIDTVGTFTQRYGVFSARIKIQAGNGLWPAFWLAQPQNALHQQAEIDAMEVCANDAGMYNGNDITLLHHYVHRADGSRSYAIGYRTDNLAGAWHVYSVEWRPDHVTFYFDGLATSTFTVANNGDVPDMKMAIVLDQAVGGRFCGATDATTPAVATLQVDWVRVTR